MAVDSNDSKVCVPVLSLLHIDWQAPINTVIKFAHHDEEFAGVDADGSVDMTARDEDKAPLDSPMKAPTLKPVPLSGRYLGHMFCAGLHLACARCTF